jgi:hypothetical protein
LVYNHPSMPKYVRTEVVDAEQVQIADKDKGTAKKSIPTTSNGGSVRYEAGTDENGKDKDFFSVLIPKVGRQANEGDWVVTDSRGQVSIVTNEAFGKNYKAVAEEKPTQSPQPTQAAAVPAKVTTGEERRAAREQMAVHH